ncbi:MAG: hypothetical protein H0W50_08950 [Parachlamydiaceae bacterium]|nr:hypothetical protein [Parachlamydiaceae bacterium]
MTEGIQNNSNNREILASSPVVTNANNAEITVLTVKNSIMSNTEKKPGIQLSKSESKPELAKQSEKLEKTSFLSFMWSGLKKAIGWIMDYKSVQSFKNLDPQAGKSLYDLEKKHFKEGLDEAQKTGGESTETRYLEHLLTTQSELLPNHDLGLDNAIIEFKQSEDNSEFISKFLDGYLEFKASEQSNDSKNVDAEEVQKEQVESEELTDLQPYVYDAESEYDAGEKWEDTEVIANDQVEVEVSQDALLQKLKDQGESFEKLQNTYDSLKPSEQDIFKDSFDKLKNQVSDTTLKSSGSEVMADINLKNIGKLDEKMKLAPKLGDIQTRIENAKNFINKVSSEEKEELEMTVYDFTKRSQALNENLAKPFSNVSELNRQAKELDNNLKNFETRISSQTQQVNETRPRRIVGS